MQTLFKLFILAIGGVLVISGCASSVSTLSTDMTSTTQATPTPKQMTRDEITAVKSQAILGTSDSFVFYNSYASW